MANVTNKLLVTNLDFSSSIKEMKGIEQKMGISHFAN